MRLTMLTVGSRGEVQPQLAVARELQAAGHRVRFAAHANFAALVSAGGLEHVPISGDSERFFAGLGGVVLTERGSGERKVASFLQRFLQPFMRRFFLECWQACEDAEGVLLWPMSMVGPSLAERLGVPCLALATYPVPYFPTMAFPCPFTGQPSPWLAALAARLGLVGLLRYATWLRSGHDSNGLFHDELTRWRRETLGLPASSRHRELRRLRRLPHVLGFSPLVLAKPRAWPDRLHVTGYWFLDLAGEWTPPAELADFLADGVPPVVIGFGSMAARDPQALTGMAIAALRDAGARGILLTGWGGLSQSDLPDTVLKLAEAPHDWLLPRAAAVVHHGGSGATAAGLRAGIPALAVPFGFDQLLWGRQLARCGAGVPPIPAAELSRERLTAAIRSLLTDGGLRRQAAALGEQIRAENGSARAAGIIGEYLAAGSRSLQ